MATIRRTIQSPGVEIREFDLSERLSPPQGTSIYISGFAKQGPTDEVTEISSMNDFELVYGKPTNAAERYLYHTTKAVFQNRSARVTINRLPYGSNNGTGFGSFYTALVFPAKFYNANTNVMTNDLDGLSGVYFLGKPKQFSLTKAQYQSLIDGTGFTWSSIAAPISAINSVSDFSKAGAIVINKGQTTIDQGFKGYYISMVDNVDADNIGSSFNKIQTALTVSQTAVGGLSNYTNIPSSVLTFSLTSAAGNSSDSLSYTMETASKGYIIGDDNQYDDVLNVGVFKLNNSVFLDDPNKLILIPQELYTGSFTDPFRQFAPTNGGAPVTYSLQNIIADKSANISLIVNPYINNQALDSIGKGTSFDSNSTVKTLKKVRTINHNMISNYTELSASVGYSIPQATINSTISSLGYVDSLLPLGSYSPTGPQNDKVIGNLVDKLNRSLSIIKDDELYDVDMLLEGGLGTIYAFTQITGEASYDDASNNQTWNAALTSIQRTKNVTGTDIQTYYNAIAEEFLGIATTFQQGGRGDTFFIADPIRHLFIQGANTKTSQNESFLFSRDIYWALRNLYSNINTSYAATYANWVAVIDNVTNTKVWMPPSGFVAARMVATDEMAGPWIAPAGFNRGGVKGIVDIAFTPNQRQRDDLYKARMNPIAQFPGQGNVIFGQKTLQTKPSAFDRINVRRGFLYYEKSVKSSMKYFVFEPNTEFTRNRVLGLLNPFFEQIRSAQGVYDFLVVCDDRNNTPNTIDENELIVDIYLKPVRAAEFILVNFYATKTGANFEELIAKA
jgi:hypothetical protein